MGSPGLKAARDKMVAEGVDEVAIETFAHYYRLLEHGETGMIPESTIDPVDMESLDDVTVDDETAQAAIRTTAVIKLNGGLGTSMGMDRAKSLLCVRKGMNFLDIICRQVLHLRETRQAPLPLIFMNSFRTSEDTMAAVARYDDLPVAGLPLEFLQNKEPKLLTKDLTNQALRTALDPTGSWIPSVLAAADKRLSEVRRHVPDAGGLVIATDQDSARAYAKILRQVSGEAATVVLSDEKAASKKISTFAEDTSRWMVAVRMVSEGVDVPRLAVGVWATTTSTPLFFAQAVGRFVRARNRGEVASVFLPSVPNLLGFASEMEVQRDHVLGRKVQDEDDIFAAENDLLAAANAEDGASDDLLGTFEAIGSEARFDHVLYDGATFGHEGEVQVGSEEEMDFLGIPGLLEPDQMRDLLRQRQADRAKSSKRPTVDAASEPARETVQETATHEQLAVLRRELNGLVGAWYHRTGQPHGVTHAALRKECGGPAAAVANADQLRARIDRVRDWAARKTS
jgi:hypothetical protein